MFKSLLNVNIFIVQATENIYIIHMNKHYIYIILLFN